VNAYIIYVITLSRIQSPYLSVCSPTQRHFGEESNSRQGGEEHLSLLVLLVSPPAALSSLLLTF